MKFVSRDFFFPNQIWACNPKSQIPTIFSTFFKSQKWSAQNEAIFGGQNQKNAKKNFKNFYCPKSSEISY